MDNDSSFDLFRTLRQRVPLILLCVIVTAAAAFAISKGQRKQYQTSASVYFRDPGVDQIAAGLYPAPTDHSVQIDTNLKLARLPRIGAATAAIVGHGVTPGAVQNSVNVTKQGDADFATVTATSTSPTLAAQIANTYAAQIVADRRRTSQGIYGSIARALTLQFLALPPGQQQHTQGATLRDRANSLRVLDQLEGSEVQVVSQAGVPSSASSPQVVRDTVLGAVLGLLLGLALALLVGRFDRRVREPGDLADVYGVPLIGVVPFSSALKAPSKSPRAKVTPPAEAEIFGLLWARIRYFNVDRELGMLLIASAQPNEGKTTVARNLALAAAKVGSRVLLIECDFRSPALAKQLGVAELPGISDVLLESTPLEDAVQPVELAQPDGRQIELDVLVAGGLLPPNPALVIESHAMEALLDRARAAYDFVLIDAPALGVVSDAFPLLRLTDGVVVVGRLGRNRSDVAARLRETLVGANAPLIGVIANGYRRRPGSTYGYDKNLPAAALQPLSDGVASDGSVRLEQSSPHDQVTRD